MKKNIFFFIPIFIFILFSCDKAYASFGEINVYSMPTSTTAGNYITLSNSYDETVNSIKVVYSLSSNLQLVGFIPVSSINCTFNGSDTISCSSASGITANKVFVYPILRIKTTFTGNESGSANFTTSSSASDMGFNISGTSAPVKVTGITIKEKEKTLTAGESFQIEASVNPKNAENSKITYKSNDFEVATVSESGLVTAVSEGKTTITVSCGDVTENVTINVQNTEVTLESISLDENITLDVGASQLLNLKLTPENATINNDYITYTSSDEKVAIVTTDGIIYALSNGTADITVSIGTMEAKTTVTVTGEKNEVATNTGSSSNFLGYLLTFIISSVLTLGVVFVVNAIKNKKALQEEDDDDNSYNSYM